ncbi:MAG: DUF2630 family protein [Actinobacteria bacterium]|nr:DUF2630 family protein [Actinomycetota bacterium]
MNDEQILSQINALVEEEDALRTRHDEASLSAEERARVERIEIALDQCWDLLRQRRARREFDQDPDRTAVRTVETVEHYQQ